MQFSFNFQWAAVPQLLMAVFIFLQGLLVLIENPRSALHRTFFFLQLPVAVWMLGMGLAYMAPDAASAFRLAKIGFLGVMYIPVGTYSFSVWYAGQHRQEMLLYLGLAVTLLCTAWLNDPLFASGVYQYPWGYYIKLGPLSYVIPGLFAIFFPLFLYNFYLKYKQSAPELQRWHVLALVAGSAAFLGVVDFLPAYGISTWLPPVGFLFTGFLVTLMGYYILRHHISDIKIILGRTIGYAAFTGVILFLYTGLFILFFPMGNNLPTLIFNAVLFALALYAFSWLKQKSQRLVDELFFKEKIDYPALISEFNGHLRNLNDVPTLLQSLFSFFTDQLRLQSCRVIIWQPRGRHWQVYERTETVAYREERQEADVSSDVFAPLIRHPDCLNVQEYAAGEYPRSLPRAIAALISACGGKIAIPLVHHQTFLGFIILGEKNSGERYSKREISLFNDLTVPFCIAWENARLYESMQYSAKLKSDFVSVASHQLRTPLTSLKWALKTILNQELGSLTDEQTKLMQNLFRNTDNMIQIVNQWLDIARLEEAKAEVNRDAAEESFPFPQLAKEIFAAYAIPLHERQITLSVALPDALPWVAANKEYTKTVLAILLDNAIRYTPRGGRITCAAVPTTHHEIQISVQDTGIGIPTEQEEYIFTKFFRAPNAVAAQPNGSGLGLFLAKTIVEKQGGSIWFRSRERKGTTFFITLPTAQS